MVMLISAPSNVTEIFPATAASVPEARRFAGRFATDHGASPERVDAIRLAVSEAFTNAVIHGYRGARGEVCVTLGLADGDLWVFISDHGCGPQTPTSSPGLGWGLALIADSSDEFVVAEGSEGGTEVQMRFAIDPVRTMRRRTASSTRGGPSSRARRRSMIADGYA